MADRSDKPTAEELASDKLPKAASDDDTAFTVEEWLDRYYVALGVPQHVVAGAFAEEGRTKSVSIADAKARVRDWQKAPMAVTETPQEV